LIPTNKTVAAGALLCLATILLGPLYTEAGYDRVRHSVSELAAHGTENAWFMRIVLDSYIHWATIDEPSDIPE
jgi:hypothetical protein